MDKSLGSIFFETLREFFDDDPSLPIGGVHGVNAAAGAGGSADVQAALTRLDSINTKLQGVDAADVAADAALTPPAPPATSLRVSPSKSNAST